MPADETKYAALIDQESTGDLEIINVKRKYFSQGCIWGSFKTTILIVIYFIPSIGLTFYQRWLLKDFHYPLSVVLVHLFVKFVFAAIIREIWSCIKHQPKKTVPWKQFVRSVAPTGIASGLDVGLSNWGLEYVPVSLYAMTKSTTIIFILICAIIFNLEKKSWSLVTIVLMISTGLFMLTYKSTQFNTLGFCLLLLASFASGIRWTCAQLLMQKSNGLANPTDMIYHVQPWMIVSLLPIAIASEGQSFLTSCLLFRSKDTAILFSVLMKVFVGAIIAFGMEFSEFLVVNKTSSLTLSIAGIFKEITVVILAILNGDILSPINYLGLIICLGGITSHIIHKIKNDFYKENERRGDTYSVHYGQDLKTPLINAEHETVSNVSDEESDSQIIFNILNSRDR